MINTIEQRAEAYIKAKYPNLNPSKQFVEFFTEGYIAGATEERSLMEKEKINANTPPENLLKVYDTFAENAAHQSGFLIGCEWKTASLEERVKELEIEIAGLKKLNAEYRKIIIEETNIGL